MSAICGHSEHKENEKPEQFVLSHKRLFTEKMSATLGQSELKNKESEKHCHITSCNGQCNGNISNQAGEEIRVESRKTTWCDSLDNF